MLTKNNKETVFQFFSALTLIVGLFLSNYFIIIGSFVPLVLSIMFWYDDNIKNPIRELRDETRSLRKDLNIRKEIEDIRIELLDLKNVKNKK